HPRFRAAFDFLELRGRIDGRLKELIQWWAEYQQANAGQRDELASHSPAVAHGSPADDEPSERAKPRRRRRRSPRRPKEGAA
ncbi:MAG: polynucleotide adenylyltransferase, partial [Aeromonadaceae bacterium]|nr:polynucleotide adenylyltransferase [Aeromonadaceae bacterium]